MQNRESYNILQLPGAEALCASGWGMIWHGGWSGMGHRPRPTPRRGDVIRDRAIHVSASADLHYYYGYDQPTARMLAVFCASYLHSFFRALSISTSSCSGSRSRRLRSHDRVPVGGTSTAYMHALFVRGLASLTSFVCLLLLSPQSQILCLACDTACRFFFDSTCFSKSNSITRELCVWDRVL